MTTDKYDDVQAEQLRAICRRYETRCNKLETMLRDVTKRLYNQMEQHPQDDTVIGDSFLVDAARELLMGRFA